MKIMRSIRNSLLIFLSFFMAFQPIDVLAIDRTFFSGNDILFYNPEDCNSGAAGGTASLVGNDNAEQIWNYLVGNDGNLSEEDRLTPEQAAGVMGNIYEESKYKPDVTEIGGGGGYGIVQWTNYPPGSPTGRRANLENAAKKAGVAVSDLGFQLTYMFQESKSRTVTARDFKSQAVDNNEWKTLQSLDSIEDATLFWHQNFEISNDTVDMIQERVTAAKDAYASFKDKVPSGAASSNTSNKCGNAFNGGDLKETLLAYAWPDKRTSGSANATTPTAAYKTAIEKAQKDGQYVGGPPPGIDCGAFITRLMIDSGFEPDYNYKGKGGNTTVQEKWLKENWEFLGSGSKINVGDLQLGDVAIKSGSGASGHTFVFVGDIADFESDTASASLGGRAPSAAYETPTDGTFNWYRKK